MRRATLIVVFAFCLAYMAGNAMAALSLGSTTSQTMKPAQPGETVGFKVLLFNIHEPSGIHVEAGHNGPSEWDIEASMDSFELGYHPPGECPNLENYECLATPEGDVMAMPLYLSAYVPRSTEPGIYEVSLWTTISGSGHVSMEQSRRFDFMVNVMDTSQSDSSESVQSSGLAGYSGDSENINREPGKEEEGKQEGGDDGRNMISPGNVTTNSLSGEDGITGGAATGFSSASIIFIVVALIALVSWKIYKME